MRDVIATAALVGAIFGKGGGSELDSALALQSARRRFGTKKGNAAWRDFRSAEDPEAPVTVLKRKFPYQKPPKKVRKGSLALPDRGVGGEGRSSRWRPSAPALAVASSEGVLGRADVVPAPRPPTRCWCPARESASGRPLAIFGPQTGYFNPQILMEIDLHGPGIDARGAAFNGVNLYVTLGRGRDYAWSATSSSQDIIDTFAVDLCEPERRAPDQALDRTTASAAAACRWRSLERRNSWSPSAGDIDARRHPDPARAAHEARPRDRPRDDQGQAGGLHEAALDLHARGRRRHRDLALQQPERRSRARADFQRAANELHYAFHWFYADSRDIAYINTGDNPVRARGVNQNFPVRGEVRVAGLQPRRLPRPLRAVRQAAARRSTRATS